MLRNDYRRALIMLRPLERGYAGHARLERRTLMATLCFTATAPGAAALRAALVGWRGSDHFAAPLGALRRDSRGRDCVRVGDVWRLLPYIEVWVWPLKNGERQEGFQTPIALYTTERGESVALQNYRALCEQLKAEAQSHENVTQA